MLNPKLRDFILEQKVLFKAVQPGDPLWDEDGWDGEQCIYRPTTPLSKVEYMVIYNQY